MRVQNDGLIFGPMTIRGAHGKRRIAGQYHEELLAEHGRLAIALAKRKKVLWSQPI
jgi:hypothetical protein